MEQAHGSPLEEQIPWPCCVIFTAVQSKCGRAATIPATTEVFPTSRDCPPTTTTFMGTLYCLRCLLDIETLKDLLEERGSKPSSLWNVVGSKARVSEILSG